MPQPKWGQVREFCLKQGYIETRTGHFRYLKVLPDRTTSGTMVSMGVDGKEVPSLLWQRVWKKQLRLASEEEFWKGLRGEPIRYTIANESHEQVPLPQYLQRFLRDVLHRSHAEIAQTTREQAQEMLNDYYSKDLQEP